MTCLNKRLINWYSYDLKKYPAFSALDRKMLHFGGTEARHIVRSFINNASVSTVAPAQFKIRIIDTTVTDLLASLSLEFTLHTIRCQ